MATKYYEENLDIPLSTLGAVPRGFGMDIGGTLIKMVYATVIDDMVRFHFLTYAKSDIHNSLADMKRRLSGSIKPGDKIYTTGVGCNQFLDIINESLDVVITNKLEMDCSYESMMFFVKNMPMSQYLYPKSEKAAPFIKEQLEIHVKMMEMMQKDGVKLDVWKLTEGEEKTMSDERKLTVEEVFPCLLCTLGSGAFYCTMDADGKGEMIDINTSCGRMFMGLGSLLTGAKTFEELIELAEAGDDSNVETKCKHIRNSDVQDFYSLLPDETPIYCFGQTTGRDLSDFKREDLAAALVSQLAQHMAQSCHLANMCSDVKTVFFSGSVCSKGEIIRDEITKHFSIKSMMNNKGINRDFHFLKYGGYIGALGCLLAN